MGEDEPEGRAGERTGALLQHLASRPGHDEVKAGFRDLLISEFGVPLDALEFERRVPEVRGRLDALIGRTIFEAKRNLDREGAAAEKRMADYLADREREEGEQFVGLASDGLKWMVFEREDGRAVKVKETVLDPEKPAEFLAWLDGVVALKTSLPPDPLNVRAELGRDSIAFRRAFATLKRVWAKLSNNTSIRLKRQLWAQLLRLVQGRDADSDPLWLQHTYLVIIAKAMAHAVLSYPVYGPKDMLSGRAFVEKRVYGAVESDFFDWIVADAEGEDLVRRLIAHAGRFRLREVKSDVLKVLYEELIDRAERHGLGEYYTPDWLAARMVRRAVERPLRDRVLDPACGSGAFLFHAVRNVIADARRGGAPANTYALEATTYVSGLDIHPVAVIIARATYLLALGDTVDTRKEDLHIPVYLADAMQLSTSEFFNRKEIVISVPPAPEDSGPVVLKFPDVLCRDARLFDTLIEAMRAGEEKNMPREKMESHLTLLVERHYKRDINDEEREGVRLMGETYLTYTALCRSGRDSIWAFIARNLTKPLVYSFRGGQADVLIGNPPWVAFRHMSKDLQQRFKELAEKRDPRANGNGGNELDKGEGIYVGGKLATQNDLSALYLARGAGLYLRPSGRLAFVMPLAALTRAQFGKLRTGDYESVKIAFTEAWTMDDSLVPLFPVPACVLIGERRSTPLPVPETVNAYSGRLPFRDADEDTAERCLVVQENMLRPATARLEGGSVYRKAFRNGATLVPRMLCLVERPDESHLRIRSPLHYPTVVSRRAPRQEKAPWKDLPSLRRGVNAQFVRPVLLGESIAPYRVFRPSEGIIPVYDDGRLLPVDKDINGRGHLVLEYDGLFDWMDEAGELWRKHGKSSMTLLEQWNYYGKLVRQFPIAPLRVVYSKAGTLPAAAVVRETQAVIDHTLYWFAPGSEDEGHYLAAILNSETARARAAHLQARGQFGARHFDKVVFNLCFPRFNSLLPLHRELAEAARAAERVAARVALPEGVKFQRARKMTREALADAGLAQGIDRLTERLLAA